MGRRGRKTWRRLSRGSMIWVYTEKEEEGEEGEEETTCKDTETHKQARRRQPCGDEGRNHRDVATRQRMLEATRSWKRQKPPPLSQALEGREVLSTLISGFQTPGRINVCD